MLSRRAERNSSYSVESTLERGSKETSPLYVVGSKSLENLIKEARKELGQEPCKEEIYMDMGGGEKGRGVQKAEV